MIRDYFTHADGKLSIVTDGGIYEYPDSGFLDFGTKQIPVRLEANWGNLYSLVNQSVMYDLRIDYLAEGTGTFDVELYINDEATPYHTLSFPVSQTGVAQRKLPPRGRIRSLRIVLIGGITGSFEVSRITLGLVKRPTIGS